MSPKITVKEDYILVEPAEGTDLREIQKGLARLFYVKGIPKQNRIWVFREGPRNLSLDDLPKLLDIIEGVFIKKTREEWMKIFDEKGEGIAYSAVLRPTDLADDSQALENGYVAEIQHPSLGPIKMVGNPVSFTETPVTVDGSAPCFGQNTEEVLLDVCGYDWDKIQQLKDEEVI